MDAIIVGGGAAGMMAAVCAARRGLRVTLIEKNGKTGKKLYITGKGRCNLTNASPPEALIENVIGNPHFLYSAFYSFDADALIDFFARLGVPTKVERGDRVFPVSDKASDVIRALEKEMARLGVETRLNEAATGVLAEGGRAVGVRTARGELRADGVIIATGGLAYPSTGSTGDGYTFARAAGHTVTPLFPSLTSLTVAEPWVKDLQGLSLRNVEVTVKRGKEKLFRDFGEMLFTHRGVSGPLILSASRFAEAGCQIAVNLKPALDEKELDARLLRDFEAYANKDYINALDDLLPRKLIPVIVSLTGVAADKKIRDFTREDRRTLLAILRGLTMRATGNTGFEDAVITAGGVCVDEVSPSTMESKITRGLYFAGEVLDVDAFTGGYNLQIAFSTGFLAGQNVCGE